MKKNECTQQLIMRSIKDYSDRCAFEDIVNDYLNKGYKVADVRMPSIYDEYNHRSICNAIVVVEERNIIV